MVNENYLESVSKQFRYYKMLGDKTIAAVPEQKINWQFNPESNSIGMLMRHMAGNMLSRFTDFLTSDGEKEWRNRDDEFRQHDLSKTELVDYWEQGWNTIMQAISQLTPEQLETIVYIRNEGHTVLEAINRQLAHYPYHIGQIVFLGKMIADEDWVSLSIPRGKSDAYNHDKFEKPQQRAHFTDNILPGTGRK